ncbi:FMN-binding protein [Pectobacterium brasiliense]|uniref:FMN-binding protein n=1 Tax=Pectobacterium brasiliense TaxID=180957 RepID=UPI001968AA53|nr:FMN-binding protein [Pectobacterium brasiliense]MBN3122048.1 FMN-binding protein [Pectobacterium brasiliense]QSD22001.1 FMN-binding protein [Pectobacterium brasiliense]
MKICSGILPLCLLFAIGTAVAQEENFKAGTYSAARQGIGGDVTVTLDIDAQGKVLKSTIDAPEETPEVGGEAAIELAKTMTEKQSIQVDGVSGATMTSGAVKEAAEDAYSQAKAN